MPATCATLAVLMLLPVAWQPMWAVARQKLPPLPDRYAALDPWIEGEIVEVRESGGVLRLASVRLPPGSRGRDVLFDDRATTWVELRYAKGLVYFDDPEGGPQLRMSLKDGHEHFEVGQLIEIGRSTQFQGGFDRTSISIGNRGRQISGSALRFRGWIMIRVNQFRARQ